MNKKQFLHSLQDVYCRLAPTKHGVGVVAIRSIPKGTDPFKNCDPWGDVITFSEKELAAARAPKEAKKLVRDLLVFQDGLYYAPNYSIDAIDKSYFLNHSRTPNMIVKNNGENFVTARRIRKGEELTSDYRTYDETKQRFKL